MIRLSAPDAGIRLVIVLLFVIHVTFLPENRFLTTAGSVALVGFAAGASRVRFSRVLRRVRLGIPVVLTFLAFAPFLPGRPVLGPVLGICVSHEGLATAARLGIRTLLVLVALGLLLETTSPEQILAAGRGRGPLASLTPFLALAYRYLALLTEEFERMQIALGLRGFRFASYRTRLMSMSGMVGTLAVRTLERGERIHHAMRLRGFDGHHFPGPTTRTSPESIGVLGLAVVSLVLVRMLP